MAATLVAYVVMHSPVRDAIGGAFGFDRRTCYFCLPRVTGFDAPDSLAAAVLLLLSLLAAWSLAARFPGPRYDRLLVFGLAALALVTVPASMLGGLASLLDETYLRPPAGPLLAAIPAAILVSAGVGQGWRPSRPAWPALPGTPLLRAVAVAAGLLVSAELAASLLHPPSQGDALTYHGPLGVLFWTGGDLTSLLDRSPETWGLAHPGTAELWYGALRLLGGERLANLGQVPYAWLGSVAVYAFTRRTGLLHGAAALAGTAFLVVPMVVLQLGTQANDLAGAAMVMAVVALASAPARDWGLARVAMLGLALGLAAVTKLALLPSVAAIGVFVLVAIARARGHAGHRADWAAVAVLMLAFMLVVTPWWARNIAREGNPVYPQSIPAYGHGVDLSGGIDLDYDFVERRFAWPLYPAVEPIDDRSGFGALLAIALIPGLIAALARARRRPLALYGLTLAVTLVFWWIYSHHEPRFLLAYAGLALTLVPWALLAVPRRRRPLAAGLAIAAAAFTVAVTLDQQVVPLGRQSVDRAEFYDRVYGVDPAAESLPEDEGLLLHTGYGLGSIDYASYYPLLGPSQERLVVQLDAGVARGSRAAVVERMRRHGLRYAYVEAVPRHRREVERLFGRPDFQLVHASTIVPGERMGVRRTAFRRASRDEADRGVRRYLFRLVRSSS